ncbi:MAG: hypothetical protein ACD_60C00120G0015 [uncultured bacterium]|nr:MAG: hypothetical protein ACD_60C00120G0015 [uncultured bacterium]
MLGAVNTAYALGEGFYFGGQVGQTKIQNSVENVQTQTGSISVTPKNTGVGARIFVGYHFNENVGLEFGAMHYGDSTYKVSGGCSNPTTRQNAIDFLGKGMFPFWSSGVSIFGKGGFAYVNNQTTGTLASGGLSASCNGSNESKSSVRPEASLGVSYDVTDRWMVDLSYTRMFSGSNIPTSDFIAFGLSYHMTDQYCGQFLC